MTVAVDDLFCGAGGSSLGAELGGARLRLGLNHWERAVQTHATNFQHADHDCADISALTTSQIPRYVSGSEILLASPECTNHSLAKGARRRPAQAPSLFDDGPAGDAEQDRSRATMWDVIRFCEQAQLKGRPYRFVVVENVVDVVKWGYGDDGGLFNAWLLAMEALGYQHECVYLNSMICWPTPQSRDRIYVVCWLRGVRRPNLRFDPRCWCPGCTRIVDGRQTWKQPAGHAKLGRVWGRYGAQYFYTCPDCRGPVLPAVFPAMSIIDWRLEAERIGDRQKPLAPNTRRRIRVGLERLASEPFAIRLTHGGAPRPLTLPVVTLTQRHDAAMVLPVAGNTFERTPGNRARDAHLVPLDTLHTTHDRAVVVPLAAAKRLAHLDAPGLSSGARAEAAIAHPRGVAEIQRHGDVRPVHEPVHTVRAGGQHHAIVMRNNNGGAEMSTPPHEPIRTLTSRGHQALVMANIENGVPRSAGRSPTQTVRTAGSLALVVPYDSTGTPRVADEQPTHTLTTRDRAAVVFTEEEVDDCQFRMFALHEIAGAMAMEAHADGAPYVVLGNKRERMGQYGNAVTPPAMALLVGRLLEQLA
jgi:DNA (cytosine-5)-methyltransferase 1